MPSSGTATLISDLSLTRGAAGERIRRHFEFLRDELPDFARGCLFGNPCAEIVDHQYAVLRVKGSFDSRRWP